MASKAETVNPAAPISVVDGAEFAAKRREAKRANKPLPLATVAITFNPPSGWTDEQYDAALATLDRDVGLNYRLMMFVREWLASRETTSDLIISVGYSDK